MPTIIFKVDCGKTDQQLQHDLHKLENKVQEALTEIDYSYLVFDTEYKQEALLDLESPDFHNDHVTTVNFEMARKSSN